jgi:hypothetical protein
MTKQQGNVLFLILIAVALFAALSYAITGSSRSGGDQITDTKARIAAGQLIQYLGDIEKAVTRVMLINGCNDRMISFERAPFDGSDPDFVNNNAPSDFRCHIFHPQGGGVPFVEIEEEWLDSQFNSSSNYKEYGISGRFQLYNYGTDCEANECMDLVAFVPFIKKTICEKIQEKFNSTTDIDPEGITNYSVNGQGDRFKGGYLFINVGVIIANTPSAETYGKSVACFKSVYNDSYHLYYGLLPR